MEQRRGLEMRIIRKRGRSGYQRIVVGEVEVCCHQGVFEYDITGVRRAMDQSARLEGEAEERARTCINEGYWSGELNCVIDGELEVRGWWKIAQR